MADVAQLGRALGCGPGCRGFEPHRSPQVKLLKSRSLRLFCYAKVMTHNNVQVGIAVFVMKHGKFLIMQRTGSHGAGSWALPGGKIDFGESFEQTSQREVREETGLEITNIRFGGITNDIFKDENKHFATIWMLSDWESGHERILEPNKCLQQTWCTLETIPTPRFAAWETLFASDFIKTIKQQTRA